MADIIPLVGIAAVLARQGACVVYMPRSSVVCCQYKVDALVAVMYVALFSVQVAQQTCSSGNIRLRVPYLAIGNTQLSCSTWHYLHQALSPRPAACLRIKT